MTVADANTKVEQKDVNSDDGGNVDKEENKTSAIMTVAEDNAKVEKKDVNSDDGDGGGGGGDGGGASGDGAKNAVSQQDQPADFEAAMRATGFGWFNAFMLFVSIPAMLANMFESTTMSYILPVAECDLKLTLIKKGWLNAITYAGMIMSAVIWGYLADTLGRRKILIYGYLADTICVFGSSLSQNFGMLLFFKFMGGFVINGPGAVLFTYLSEMHGAKHRPRVLLVVGIIASIGGMVLPLLAWGIFPRDWDFVLFDNFNVHTWQIFLFVSGLFSLISCILFTFMPESPKFLMSQGRNAEALHAFQYMYSFNTRKPKDTYPVKVLVEEVPNRDGNENEVVYTIEDVPVKAPKPKSFCQRFSDGMQQIKPMFRKPLLGRSLHVYILQMCVLLGMNTIRLWLPQVFASIGEYEEEFAGTDESSNLCTILEYSLNKTTTTVTDPELTDCSDSRDVSVSMYTNNMIVSISGVLAYFLASGIVRLIGQKRLLTYGLFISAALSMGLYWSTTELSTLIISSAYISIAGVSTSSLLSLVMAFFPTSLRSLVVSTAMMFGRLGALTGNVLFPVLMEIGCVPPFLMVCTVLVIAGILSILLPSSKKATFS